MTNIREIFAESWQKTARPGPAEIRARPARPSPLKFAGRNGPARFVEPEIYNPVIKSGPLQFNLEISRGGVFFASC